MYVAAEKLIDQWKLAFAPSWHCDARCTHCFISRSLRCRDDYDSNVANNLFSGLPPEIRVIGFTGGEPFLHPRRLIRLMRRALAMGRASTVSTNGLWAINWNSGLRLLKNAAEAGLLEITLSLDRYHRPSLPVEVVKRLMTTAIELGLEINLKTVGGRKYSTINKIRQADLFDEQKSKEIHIFLEHVGEATKIAKEHYPVGQQDHCIALMTPAVLPDGSIFACCSAKTLEFRDSILRLGNVLDKPLEQSLDIASRHWIFAAMMALGPRGLWGLIGKPWTARQDSTSMCSNCQSIFEDPSLISMIEEAIRADASIRKEISARVMLMTSGAISD